MLPHKRHFQNCSIKNIFFKVTLPKRQFLKYINLLALIYSSSKSSESSELSKELYKSSIICLISFFLNIFTLFYKHLRLIILIFLESIIQANYCKTSMIGIHPSNFFIAKIGNTITMKFYSGFQNLFYYRQVRYPILFYISVLTLSQIVLYFSNKLSSLIKKCIHLICPS